MSSSVRVFLGLLIASVICCAPLRAAPFDAERAELEAIDKLSGSSTAAALVRIDALKARVGEQAPYPLRRDLLLTEIWLREDAGQLERVYQLSQDALKLALANNDPVTATLARIGAVRELLDNNRPVDADKQLAQILATMPKNPPAHLRLALARIEGDVFNSNGKFDKSLAAYLRGLKLEQDDGRAEGNADLMARIARVYVNIDNSAKALETTQQALAIRDISPRVAGHLQFTRGIALSNLNRGAEAITAFRLALSSAEQSGMSALEAAVRGNIADYYLRQKDYVRAEQEARLALIASEKVADQNNVMMAKANIGFALMGQGRIAAGLPFIDGVIADMRKAVSNTDIEAMMDEKSRMLEQAGLYKDALATVREQQVVQQTSARAARDRAIAALQEEFDATQRTRQIDSLRRENQAQEADLRSRRQVQLLTTFAAVLTVVAGAIMFVLYRRAARANGRLHELNTQLEFHSMRDSLTGLHNRRSFQQKMLARTAQGARDRRRDQPSTGVDCFVLMDIDHFKQINDRWGHGVGDSVLVEVACRLNAVMRDTDMVLRWGGEEFLIYAPHADPGHIAEMIGRVLTAIGATPVDAGSCMVPVTMTAGVISLPFAGSAECNADWQSGIRLADWALYYGKTHGRNQARIVTGLLAPLETVLASLDNAASTLVEMDCVHGPVQQEN